MASKANSEQQRITALITEALSTDTVQPEGIGARAEAIPNPKELFCKNWNTVKTVLTVLRQFAPAFLKPLIDLVIKGGDALQKAICQ